jgi:hypothetical protein
MRDLTSNRSLVAPPTVQIGQQIKAPTTEFPKSGPPPMVLNLRRPTITALRFGCRRAVSKRQLPPPDRTRCADAEPLSISPA